ncbi:protein of unknown function [Austwickia chelonae]|uniref:Uncharacterized protein n=1 Tax=Austwickia chelonae NBRC 105200 TaxID=1184607 RepID=K6VK66_9MICO|nr:DUF2017 family protein [Austwickia chelonae]GAB77109.1 hypothetical protein AUCHE_05_00130 [Austwickia chelonae NBRC 105200]SEW02985.1 protein of unknown function [Austwickia chelonae]
MAHAFHFRQGRFAARLDEDERALLISLMEQVHRLVSRPARPTTGDDFEDLMRGAGLADLDGSAPHLHDDDLDDPGRDPALDRLLPDAHREDPLAAAEFRRMVAPGLRDRKASNLQTAMALLAAPADGPTPEDPDELLLDQDGAQSLVTALTDVRLVLGDRLDLRTDDDGDRLEQAVTDDTLDEKTTELVMIYDFLTWLQESLSEALIQALDDPT